MAKRSDNDRRRMWQQRLERFQGSGLTVVGFCQRENVSVASFYYWAKRIGTTESDGSPMPRGGRDRSGTGRAGRVTRERSSPRAVRGKEYAARIHFRWGANARVSIPADCLDALRCLAQCLADENPRRHDAFRPVVLSPR